MRSHSFSFQLSERMNREQQQVGIHAEMGNIGKALQTVQVEGTRLQVAVGFLVRPVAIPNTSFSRWELLSQRPVQQQG